jgi:hypothetical protein
MTLVLVFAWNLSALAAPSTDVKPKKINPSGRQSHQPADPEKKVQLESTSPTDVGAPPGQFSDDALISTRPFALNAWTAGAGFWFGNLEERETMSIAMFTSLTKTNYNLDETAQEFGVQILSSNLLGASWGFKWLPSIGFGQEMFYKAGFGALYMPSENIGTLINYRRYYISGSWGFEDLFKLQRHLRGDLTGTLSPLGITIQFNLGFVFGE